MTPEMETLMSGNTVRLDAISAIANRKPVESADDFYRIVKDVKPGDDLLIVVERRGYNRFLVLQTPKKD